MLFVLVCAGIVGLWAWIDRGGTNVSAWGSSPIEQTEQTAMHRAISKRFATTLNGRLVWAVLLIFCVVAGGFKYSQPPELKDCPESVTDQCINQTGGSCLFSGCAKSRGNTTCVDGSCQCSPGHCSDSNGVCTPPDSACSNHTGGTCGRFIGCSKSRGSTSCLDGACQCNPGHCSNSRGACVPESKPWCDTDTGGTCALANCSESRGKTSCVDDKCRCSLGHCSDSNGACIPTSPESALDDLAQNKTAFRDPPKPLVLVLCYSLCWATSFLVLFFVWWRVGRPNDVQPGLLAVFFVTAGVFGALIAGTLNAVCPLFCVGLIEETFKSIWLFYRLRRDVNDIPSHCCWCFPSQHSYDCGVWYKLAPTPYHIILCALASGAGFACFEDLSYVFDNCADVSPLEIAIGRALTPMHLVWTAMIGVGLTEKLFLRDTSQHPSLWRVVLFPAALHSVYDCLMVTVMGPILVTALSCFWIGKRTGCVCGLGPDCEWCCPTDYFPKVYGDEAVGRAVICVRDEHPLVESGAVSSDDGDDDLGSSSSS